MARQRLGQHFLTDVGWREEIARAIRVSPLSLASPAHDRTANFRWIEIGPGHGEMTQHLAASGAPLYAVETDAKLAASLHRLEKRFPNLTVVSADILKTDIAKLGGGNRLRIYGNLPYYITSPILQHLFSFAGIIDEIHIVVQHEVALRLVAEPGTRDYGYLTVLTRYFSRPELVIEIPRTAFAPPPLVHSALVTLRFPGTRAQLAGLNTDQFLEFAKSCFSQKRKTLVNNLKSQFAAETVRKALQNSNLRLDARAEQLSVRELAALFAIIAAKATHPPQDPPTARNH